MSSISRRKFLRDAALSGAIFSQRRAFGFAARVQPESVSAGWQKFKLFYDRPSPSWPEALPVGNGRLGAMVFGVPGLERIQLNEESIWDGEVRDRDNPQAASSIPEIRKLLFVGKVKEAEKLATSDVFSISRRMPCSQTLGDLHLDFGAMDGVTDYRLELDLDVSSRPQASCFKGSGIRARSFRPRRIR